MTTGQTSRRTTTLFNATPQQVWTAWGAAIKVLSVIIAVALLIVSAKIQVPFWPVPVTMQSAVVLLLPCVLGLRAGLASIALYLGLGAAGYPVFANAAMAAAGPAYYMGPTGGYLAGFMVSAALIGVLYEKYAELRRPLPLLAVMLAGHVVILTLGVLWLAFGVPALGMTAAIASGFTPFLFGSLAKSVLAVGVVQAINARR